MTLAHLPNPAHTVRKMLFLDFDGVLHPAWGNSLPEFVHVHALAQALTGRSCEIVISSTWREHYSLTQLKQFLSPELAGRVIGVTGQDPPGRHARHKTILQYLATLGEAVDWCVLDDSGSEFHECLNLILCDGAVGLQPAQVEQLTNWLNDLRNIASS
jgi:hypothetical protein